MSVVINPSDWLHALGGGLMIGLAAAVLLGLSGRIAGISSIMAGMLANLFPERRLPEVSWRAMFLLGLILGGLLFATLFPQLVQQRLQVGWGGMIAAGLIVGYGTRMGSGCTSGHGVCGIARTSRRSIVATATFMAAGMITVFVIRHVLHLS